MILFRFKGIVIVIICVIIATLVISINPLKINNWERGNKDTIFGMVLGLDLIGGTHLVYEIKSKAGENPSVEDAEGVRKIIERRVNEFGVSEANVQLIGSPPDKILIQIPSQSQDKITFSWGTQLWRRVCAGMWRTPDRDVRKSWRGTVNGRALSIACPLISQSVNIRAKR